MQTNTEIVLENGWSSRRQTVNGVSLHVVEAGPTDGPLLILLHGFPEFWWAWRKQITPFAERGYHVVVPDMRGYNTSDAPQDVSDYKLDVLVADVIALADSYQADKFYLVGHDWGAIVSWGVGMMHSDRLKKLVVMDGPHPDLWGKEALTHPTQALKSTYVALFQLPALPEAVLGALDFAGLKAMMEGSAHKDTFTHQELEEYTKAWAHEGSLTAMLNYYRALREREKHDPPARIAAPTFILWGEHDRFLEHHVAQNALDLCDDGRLLFVEGATHWLHIEQPERINAEVLEFLGN